MSGDWKVLRVWDDAIWVVSLPRAGMTLPCAIPVRNPPMLLPCGALTHYSLTFWSVVFDDRLGVGEKVDEWALGVLVGFTRPALPLHAVGDESAPRIR